MIGIKNLLIHSLIFLTNSISLTPNLNKLSKYTGLSYKENNEITSLIDLPKHYGITMFYDENENLIITCRGTTNFRDWVENIKCALVHHMDCKNGMIHRGYYNKLIRIISEKEFQKIHKFISAEENVFICGHSSAAAKNILICHKLAKKHSNINFHVFAFGMPKFADSNYYRELKEFKNIKMLSFQLIDDIVPSLGIGVHDKENTIHLNVNKLSFNPFNAHKMSRYRSSIIRSKKGNLSIEQLYHSLNKTNTLD